MWKDTERAWSPGGLTSEQKHYATAWKIGGYHLRSRVTNGDEGEYTCCRTLEND